MSRITTTVVTLLLAATAFGQAKEDAGDGKKLDKQTMEWKDYLPEIHGTIRGKYEFQTETGESRFVNPEKPYVPLNKNDAFQKVQKRRVQKKR